MHEGRKGREKAIVLLINWSQFGSKPALFVHLVRTDRAAFPGGPARGHTLAGEGAGTRRGGTGLRAWVWRLLGGSCGQQPS